jgi:hypothetical protein
MAAVLPRARPWRGVRHAGLSKLNRALAHAGPGGTGKAAGTVQRAGRPGVAVTPPWPLPLT